MPPKAARSLPEIRAGLLAVKLADVQHPEACT
jgi:hypothetical protein